MSSLRKRSLAQPCRFVRASGDDRRSGTHIEHRACSQRVTRSSIVLPVWDSLARAWPASEEAQATTDTGRRLLLAAILAGCGGNDATNCDSRRWSTGTIDLQRDFVDGACSKRV